MQGEGFWYSLGKAISQTFKAVDVLGGLPNIVFTGIFVGLVVYWTYRLHVLQKRALKGMDKL